MRGSLVAWRAWPIHALIGGGPFVRAGAWCGVWSEVEADGHATPPSRTRSAARSRTDRARGLAATSAVGGLLGAAGEQPQDRLVRLGDDRQVRRGVAAAVLGRTTCLVEPVLERVVGHHDHPAADADRVDGGRQRPAQHRQLVVDLDAQRLEGALGRVARRYAGWRPGSRRGPARRAARSGRRAPGPARRTIRSAIRRANRSSPYSRRIAGQLRDRVGVEHLGGGQAGGVVHPHVERGVLGVGEAALAEVELHARDAEVEEHAVDVGEALVGQHVGDLVVHRVDAG